MTPTDPAESVALTVREPADLIAAVPYLIGFHPTDSVVVVGMRDASVIFAARADLLDDAVPADIRAAATAQLVSIVDRQRVDAAVVLGYGPADTVDPTVDVTANALRQLGIPLLDALRVTDDRYWSYYCDDPTCCPPEGRQIAPGVSPLAVAATVAGQVALPDRTALRQQVEPVTGVARQALRAATERARVRWSALVDQAPPSDLLGARTLRRAGEKTIRLLLDRQRRGAAPTDDDVAWLTLLLTDLAVRDYAWERITDEPWQVTFWQDVLRRAEPELAAGPASLLAFAAWRLGNGALARVALDRVLDTEPDYSMARLMDDVLVRGISPAALGDWPKRDQDGGDGRAGRIDRRRGRRRRPDSERRDRARPAGRRRP
ncbi:DUF4192 domain-containing protein [Solwaraspora sp. WMMD406]|uniref:DUF4192 domain-containing protein n=1 Tax=Solwaraspora sp. WMMD406 TaxID=3016095 RepID=UPI002417FA67|nr:DUF4192 domain-containing protein [Solwaraspora sp. WMMD406]MDG4763107.1 DUF4192 domain-containing protein [Solwaraspora sp. WMMD406]